MQNVRLRFWLECIMALFSTLLAALTAAWPDWIELLFGADPDGGQGSFEWGVVAAFAIAALVLAILARSEFRRSPAQSELA